MEVCTLHLRHNCKCVHAAFTAFISVLDARGAIRRLAASSICTCGIVIMASVSCDHQAKDLLRCMKVQAAPMH